MIRIYLQCNFMIKKKKSGGMHMAIMCVLMFSVHWCSCECLMLCQKCVKLFFVVLREELCSWISGTAGTLLLARKLKCRLPFRSK